MKIGDVVKIEMAYGGDVMCGASYFVKIVKITPYSIWGVYRLANTNYPEYNYDTIGAFPFEKMISCKNTLDICEA